MKFKLAIQNAGELASLIAALRQLRELVATPSGPSFLKKLGKLSKRDLQCLVVGIKMLVDGMAGLEEAGVEVEVGIETEPPGSDRPGPPDAW
jgi:phage FluMu protein gp41